MGPYTLFMLWLKSKNKLQFPIDKKAELAFKMVSLTCGICFSMWPEALFSIH